MTKSLKVSLILFVLSMVFISCNKDDAVTNPGGGSTPVAVTNTFLKSGNVPIVQGETNDILTIDSSGTINSLSFALNNIENVNAVNVDIFLLHSGVIDTLLYQTTNTGTNFIGTIFSDTASMSIQNGSGDFTGYFKPYRPLSKFNGLNINGQWTLKFISSVNQKSGVIKSWGITISYNKVQTSSQWQPIATMSNSGIRTAFFLDVNNGWMYGRVNNVGTIYRTYNGGTNWDIINQDSAAFNSMVSMHFLSNILGFACGEEGTVWKTTNGGQNWTSQNIVGLVSLRFITFLNPSTGLICGGNNGGIPGVVYKTTDAGNTWFGGTVGSTYSYLECIKFANFSTVYASGDYDIIKSIDGGNTWSVLVTYGSVFRGEFPHIHFLDANTGYIAANLDGILYTSNGGLDWVSRKPNPIFAIRSVFCTDLNTCYVAGADTTPYVGRIYKSTNAGLDWNLQLSVPNFYMGYVQFLNPTTGYAGGIDNPQNPTQVVLYKTTTGGSK